MGNVDADLLRRKIEDARRVEAIFRIELRGLIRRLRQTLHLALTEATIRR